MRLRNSVNAPARYGEVDDRRRGPTEPLYPDLLAAQTAPYNPDLPPAAFPSLPLVGNVDTGRNDPKFSTQSTEEADPEPDNELTNEEISDEVDEMEMSDKDSTSDYHGDAEPSFDFHAADRAQRDTSFSDSDAEEIPTSWSSLALAVQFQIFNTLLKTANDSDVVAATLNLTPEELADIEYRINLRKIHPATYDEVYQYAVAASGSEFGFIDPDKMDDYLEYLTFASHYEIAGESEVNDGRKFLLHLGLDATMMDQFKEDDQGMKLSQLPVADLNTAGAPVNANAHSAAYTTSTIMEDKDNEEAAYNMESGVDDIIGLESPRTGCMHAAGSSTHAEDSHAVVMDARPSNSPLSRSMLSTGIDFDDTTKTKQTTGSVALSTSISKTVRKRGKRQSRTVLSTNISQLLSTAKDRATHISALLVADSATDESRTAGCHEKQQEISTALEKGKIHENHNPDNSVADSDSGAKSIKGTTCADLATDINQPSQNDLGKEEESKAIALSSATDFFPFYEQINQSARRVGQVVFRSELQTTVISPEIRDNGIVTHEYTRLTGHNKPFLGRLMSAAAEAVVLPHRQSQMRIDLNARETGSTQNDIQVAGSIVTAPAAVNNHKSDQQTSVSSIHTLQNSNLNNVQDIQPLLSAPCETIFQGPHDKSKLAESIRKHIFSSQGNNNEELHNIAAATLNELPRRDRTAYATGSETEQSNLTISNPVATTSSNSSMDTSTATDPQRPEGLDVDNAIISTGNSATNHNEGSSWFPPRENYHITDPRWMPPSYKIGSSSGALNTARSIPIRSPYTPVVIAPATARPPPEPNAGPTGPSIQNDAAPASTGKRRRSDFGKKRGPYKKKKTGN